VSSSDGSFALTPVGRVLTADAPGSFQPVARFYLSKHFQESWAGLADAVLTGRAAVNNIHGVESVFEVYGRDPEVAALFDAAMTALSSGAGPAVAAAYPFAGLCIDLGGGEGRLLAAILEAHPQARGLLFELPKVANKGRGAIARWGLADRCEVVAGDMFAGALPTHGDLYIMAHVLHDWDDPRARRVLKAVRAAIPDPAKLLLVERVIADPISPADLPHVLADINMMVRTGGLERTEAEWRTLLAAEGFELTRVVPTSAVNSIVEARPV
jgi:hypothetical protein